MTGLSSAIQRMGKQQAETLAKDQKGLARIFFKKSKRDLFTYTLTVVKHVYLICYTITGIAFAMPLAFSGALTLQAFFVGAIGILSIALLSDILFRTLSLRHPKGFFTLTCQVGSIYILPIYPFSFCLFKLFRWIIPAPKDKATFRIKDKILEILHDAEFAPYLDPNDQKLILSVVSFKERIAREVMVPRIDMFTLSANTSIREAAKGFHEEGYSRIPVWKDTMDQVIGTLYYKDLLAVYEKAFHHQEALNQPIETLLKPIVYTPETKKISQLLQEFRSKQIHLAIVVDEYGGTEGIVTIEDILEELVGEIADEYDYDEEEPYTQLPSGGWIVDAKMTILDIEEKLGVQIPASPEYDTIGGYIFHKTGSIPKKGWRLHQNDFDLEVLSSSDRVIEKIRITPL